MRVRQNSHLTFKENKAAGRHGWLRLTPAYSFKLVAETLADRDAETTVLDPFSGSGTTGLYAAQSGMNGILLDLNPFLVWLARAKTQNYSNADLLDARRNLDDVLMAAKELIGSEGLWQPPIHRIERWWDSEILDGLKALRAGLDKVRKGRARDLLIVAFCRTTIALSSAAFNHQSMSFKQPASKVGGTGALFSYSPPPSEGVFERFKLEAEYVMRTASDPLPGDVSVGLGDARFLDTVANESIDVVYTSPPYANRISYIRELRPYMYWLRFLTDSRQAGELDWKAIGGTWGIATSRVSAWTPTGSIPLDNSFQLTLRRIAADGNTSGALLARYVEKYFHDMWRHFNSAYRTLVQGGKAIYIIGNSTFFGELVPSQEWYAKLLTEAGFSDVEIVKLRKRNSNIQLYEFAVGGVKRE